jgi:aspartate dehydrogenase
VVVRPERVADVQAMLGGAVQVTASLDRLERRPDYVLELAGHAAVAEHAPGALASGIGVAIASTGALADEALRRRLRDCAERGGTQLRLLSGAVGGLDVLAAYRECGLREVRYTGRKPPHAWRTTSAAPATALRTGAPTTIFEGTAGEAARDFPSNANVAATVALAGLGFDATFVRLVADPGIEHNAHRIEAVSDLGSFAIDLAGAPSGGNAGSSALTAFSALRALRDRDSAILI